MVSANPSTVRDVPRPMEILPDELATQAFSTYSKEMKLSVNDGLNKAADGKKTDRRNYVDLLLDSYRVSSYLALY